jgi:RNA polymerase sigma-70 factor (ECF subfamily)
MTVQAADDVFVTHRTALFGLAYRMLGSVADAEEVVSDSYLRWHRAQDAETPVADAKAFLMTTTARLAIDALRSAQRRRVDYVGTWLPEPLVTTAEDPAETVERRDTISLGLLMLLEQLTPVERAVFVLREAFDFPHAEVARLLEVSPANARQLYRRASQRLADAGAPRFRADPAKQDELLARFLAAAATGQVEPLAELLAADAVLYADGGGKVASVRRPSYGGLRIARFVRGLMRQAPPDTRVDVVRANGAPAMLVRTSAEVVGIYALQVSPETGLVDAVHAIRNPDKLTRLSP